MPTPGIYGLFMGYLKIGPPALNLWNFPLPSNPDYPSPGGIPTISIGPPNANYGAVAWTQCRSQSWNDVEAMVWDTWQLFCRITPSPQNPDQIQLEASASPSVSVYGSTHAMLSYLYTSNPNSMPWQPVG